MVHRHVAFFFAFAIVSLPALAQQEEPERVPFSGGELTVTETEDYERILAFDGRELARDYFVRIEGVEDLGGSDVAIVSVGPGGNACAPSTLLVWRPEGGEIEAQMVGDDCGSPSPAVAWDRIYFVPYLLPGETGSVTTWSPDEGLVVQGSLSYTPQPGTGWSDFDPTTVGHPLDLFRNAEIFAAAQAALEDDMSDVALGLGTAAQPELTGGVLHGTGCVPHACGVTDSFVAIDLASRAIYFAQMQDGAATRFWPPRAQWPDAVSATVPGEFGAEGTRP